MIFHRVVFTFWACCVCALASQNPTFTSPKELDIAVKKFVAGRATAEDWELPDATTHSKREMEYLTTSTARLESALATYSNIPEVARMKNTYSGRLAVCLLEYPTIRSFCAGKYEDLKETKINIDLYPKIVQKAKVLKSLIMYSRGHLALPSISNQNDIWFAARFLHELYHAQLDRDGSPGINAKYKSDTWAADEVKAHHLARLVLNHGSQGKYERFLKQIVRSKNASDLSVLRAKITASDFAKLDQLFGHSSIDELANRIVQYIIDLGEVWLDSRYSGVQLTKYKIQNYLTYQ